MAHQFSPCDRLFEHGFNPEPQPPNRRCIQHQRLGLAHHHLAEARVAGLIQQVPLRARRRWARAAPVIRRAPGVAGTLQPPRGAAYFPAARRRLNVSTASSGRSMGSTRSSRARCADRPRCWQLQDRGTAPRRRRPRAYPRFARYSAAPMPRRRPPERLCHGGRARGDSTVSPQWMRSDASSRPACRRPESNRGRALRSPARLSARQPARAQYAVGLAAMRQCAVTPSAFARAQPARLACRCARPCRPP